MREFETILHKYDVNLNNRSPFEIPNMSRDDLGPLFRELRYKKGVEIGVERGIFSEILCQGNPEMTLYGVDAWTTYHGYRDHVSQEKLDRFYDETMERMKSYHFVPIRAFSMDALQRFPDGSLDFIYVDANHEFIHVARDLYEWEKKVRPGGIISGHDYRKNKRYITRNHVVYVVDAYTASYRVHPWFIIGAKAKIPGTKRDGSRSWFWIKDGSQNP